MRHGLNSESWKALLPDVSAWLEKVKVAGLSAAPATAAHHVVAVKSHEEQKDQFNVAAAKFDANMATKLIAAARALGWQPSAGALHLSESGATYTLVPLSSVKAHPRQVARQLGLDAAKATKDLKLAHLVLCAPEATSGLEIFDGYAAGLYSAIGFKGTVKHDAARFPAQISLAGDMPTSEQISQQLEFSQAQVLSRFMQDAPANYLTPAKFAEIAKDMARDCGVACKVLDKDQMASLGMGSFLSVGDGSVIPPCTIVIEIDGKDNSKCVALVGKGLTFDSGGVSIKPAAGMEEMKYDMSGGAAVLAAARYFSKVKPPTKVVCIIGASENLISGGATKPGDIVRAMNGKTIEVLNTDAEGRLVLADCLCYAIQTYKPAMVMDVATLTGAVLMALGCVGGAMMTNDAATGQHVLKAAEGMGEPMWQLPLWPEMEKETKSELADLKNIAKPSVKGGSIMGGMFLKEFVGDTKWAHLDIAGTGWNCQALGYPSGGGSSFGLRTLVGACMRFGQ